MCVCVCVCVCVCCMKEGVGRNHDIHVLTYITRNAHTASKNKYIPAGPSMHECVENNDIPNS